MDREEKEKHIFAVEWAIPPHREEGREGQREKEEEEEFPPAA